jgi:poly-gamma-glutamate synthase PgsB/CapB
LKSRISRIPLRICVTGTRGKSSVVRLIAACLRDSRMLVLAKTTGSKSCLVFPDGNEREIRRRGHPTILEGKKILKIAARTGVHAVVLEMMSIRPESLFTESIQMMKPHILVITNIRMDHVDEIGITREDIARSFASAIPERSTVIIPEEEFYPVFRQKAEKVKARLILVPSKPSVADDKPGAEIPAWEFEQNFRIALAVTEFLEKDRDKVRRALRQAFPDFGGLRVWRAEKESPASGWYFVSAFAANDPESTKDALVKLENKGLFMGRKRIGLLNLRKDRGGRTMQWFDALQGERGYAFDRLVFVGEHALVLRDKLKGRIKPEITAFREKKPEDLIAKIATLERDEAVVFGMGNMGGMGRLLVEYWEMTGNRYDV